jgi:hypothetical protein
MAGFFAPDYPFTEAQQRRLVRGIRLVANPSVLERWLHLVGTWMSATGSATSTCRCW